MVHGDREDTRGWKNKNTVKGEGKQPLHDLKYFRGISTEHVQLPKEMRRKQDGVVLAFYLC